MAEPKINVDLQWFDLKAKPAKLEKAATKWRGMGNKGDRVSENVHKAARKVLDSHGQAWKGDTRDTFETHKTSLVKSMAATKSKANDVAGALDGAATLLRNRQGDLDTLLTKLKGRVAYVANDSQITFSPENAKESKGVLNAVKAARKIRDNLDDQLITHTDALDKALTAWESVSDKWKKFASDKASDPFKLPAEADNGTQVLKLPDGSVVVNAGKGDKETNVHTDSDGKVVVTVDGEEQELPSGTPVTIRGGDGDDEVNIASNVKTEVNVLGGEGEDKITDNGLPSQDPSTGSRAIIGGDGSDRIVVDGEGKNVSAGAGNDKVTTMGDHNNVSSGDGKDKIETTGGYVSGGRSDDFVRAGNHNDNVFLKGEDVHKSTVFGGDGGDEIQGSTHDDKISGGDGEDEIYGHEGNDLISGDDGHDYIDGQAGNDNISGGAEKDVVYGLGGNDTITGGSERDYLEGAEGDDTINGGTAEDVVSGGRGDDSLHGDDGDDVMYAGAGTDDVDGGEGNDKMYVQDEDRVASDNVASNGGFVNDSDTVKKVDIADNSFVKVEGSDEFQDRMRADLDMYSSSPTGRQMMESLGDKVSDSHDDWAPGEREVVINEFDTDNGRANHNGNFSFSDADIKINPEYDGADQPGMNGPHEKVPSHVLYHELGHAYDYLHGTGIPGDYSDGTPKDERQAVGLPTVDHDKDPSTPDVVDPDHPKRYTENGLREEMERDERDSY